MKPLHSRLSPTWPGAASVASSAAAPVVLLPVVLLLHGLGSNEDDLPSLAGWLPRGMPWASLRAPIEMDHGGAAWFPHDVANGFDQSVIDGSTEAIWAWVEANVPAGAPVAPLGFSQGGLMALQLLRTRPESIAAAVVLSGLIASGGQAAGASPFRDAVLAESRPRVFWGRGDADSVIWPAAIERLAAWLPEHSTPTIRVYPGLAHSVNEDEMSDVKAFLAGTV
jgi:phospholipase/carboxylesterase